MAKIKFRSIYKYTDEFKATAVALSHLDGAAVKDIANELAIHPFMLSRWRKQSREGQIVSKKVMLNDKIASELKELKQLKKDYARLQMEHDLLKSPSGSLPNEERDLRVYLRKPRSEPNSEHVRSVCCLTQRILHLAQACTGQKNSGKRKIAEPY